MAVAIHNYHDAHGHLPPPAVTSTDGRPLLSWRVLLLPYIEEQDLFREFRLDEPWDSPHNLALLPRMPKLYEPFSGQQTPQPHATHYRVFVGPGTAFEPGKQLRLPNDFPDGPSNTFLIVEAAEPVPWTCPDELAYASGRPLPRLGGVFPARFQAAMADGSVVSFPDSAREHVIRAGVTRNGGEAVQPPGGE